MDIEIDLPEKLYELVACKSDIKCIEGGRGSAKSTSIARIIIARCIAGPIRVLCVREFQASIKESVHQLMKAQIRALGVEHLFDVKANEIRGKNGSYICYVGLHDTTAASIKSYEDFDIFWLEEAQTTTLYSWQILVPTIRKEGSELWVSLNPEEEDDPVYNSLVLNTPPNCKTIKLNWYDNKWFPERLRVQMEQDYKTDIDNARWIWEGCTRKISDAQVLKGKIEVRPFEPREHWDGPYYGFDFGFATDPSALIQLWLDDDCIYIRREVYGYTIDTDDLPAMVDTIPEARKYLIKCDSSRPETISYLRKQGIRAQAANKWSGSVEDGIAYLRRKYRIVIHPDCRQIEKESRHWKYKVNKAGQVMPVLQPGNDHGWDAVRYALDALIRNAVSKDPKPKKEVDEMTMMGKMYGGNSNSWMGG